MGKLFSPRLTHAHSMKTQLLNFVILIFLVYVYSYFSRIFGLAVCTWHGEGEDVSWGGGVHGVMQRWEVGVSGRKSEDRHKEKKVRSKSCFFSIVFLFKRLCDFYHCVLIFDVLCDCLSWWALLY